MNKQLLVYGANDFLFHLPYSRYSYCEENEGTFLWKQLSVLNIKVDIRGAWKPTLAHPLDLVLMEDFIDRGYNTAVLDVLNDIRVYMRVTVQSEISNNGYKMAKWALEAEQKRDSQWSRPPRSAPTR